MIAMYLVMRGERVGSESWPYARSWPYALFRSYERARACVEAEDTERLFCRWLVVMAVDRDETEVVE